LRVALDSDPLCQHSCRLKLLGVNYEIQQKA
jgi:hypothetical protein